MIKEMTCVVCPNGCLLQVEYEKQGDQVAIQRITGNLCKRGLEYARQEMVSPRRTIASSILVEGGSMPLVSVRTSGPIPKAMIFPVMAEIRKCSVKAPVQAGTVLIPNVLDLGVDIIATRTVE
jgi:CxxC motif-containing protein